MIVRRAHRCADRQRAAEHDLRLRPRRGSRPAGRRADHDSAADEAVADVHVQLRRLRRRDDVRVRRRCGGRADRQQDRRRLGLGRDRRLLDRRRRRCLGGGRRRRGCRCDYRRGRGRRRSRGCAGGRRQRGRRLGRRGRRGSGSPRRGSHRQERERVEIAVVVGRGADAEVDVRDGLLGRPARADRADRLALTDRRALRDRHRTEMGEGHGERVAGEDRHGVAARRHAAGERHRAGGRRDDRTAGGTADVDAAMLAARVRVRVIEGERREHGTGDRPRPRARGWHGEERDEHDERDSHGAPSVVRIENSEGATVARRSAVVNIAYSEPR